MTMCQIELPNANRLQSRVARLFQRLANWQESRHQKAVTAGSLADLSAHMRHDIGLDGGAAMRLKRGRGRSFDHSRDHDRTVVEWRF